MVSFFVSFFPAPSEPCRDDSAIFFLLGVIWFWCKIRVRILLLLYLLFFFFLGQEGCYRYNLLQPPSLGTIPCSEVLSFSLSWSTCWTPGCLLLPIRQWCPCCDTVTPKGLCSVLITIWALEKASLAFFHRCSIRSLFVKNGLKELIWRSL